MAVSPGCVFYSRYAIHEAWLVFFLVLTVRGFAGIWKWGDTHSLWAAALGITGMVLTKETYVIHIGCFALAALFMAALEPFSPSASPPRAPRNWEPHYPAIVALVCAGLILFFYSGGFLDYSSLKGLYRTF